MDVKLTSIPVCADGIKTRNESFGMLLVSKRTPSVTPSSCLRISTRRSHPSVSKYNVTVYGEREDTLHEL